MSEKIQIWSRVADENSNNDIPDGAPENATPIDSLNNIMREMMATTRSFMENMEWRDYGLTIVPIDGTHWKATQGNFTGLYAAGQRLRFLDTTYLYGTIAEVDDTGAELLVTMNMDGTTTLDNPTVVYAGFNSANQTQTVPSQSGEIELVAVDGAGNTAGTGIQPGNVVVAPAVLTNNLIVFGAADNKTVNQNDQFGNTQFVVQNVGVGDEGLPTQGAVKDYVDAAIAALPGGVGVGQTWDPVTRGFDTNYLNGGTAPITININLSVPDNAVVELRCDNKVTPTTVVGVARSGGGGTNFYTLSCVVPVGSSYRVVRTAGSAAITTSAELS